MEATQQRKNEVLASNILFGGLLLGAIILVLRVAVLKKENPFLGTKHIGASVIIIFWIIGYVFSIAHYYAIRLGKRWAKILLLILFAANVLFSVVRHNLLVTRWDNDFLYVVSYVLSYAIQLWALLLLFKRRHWQVAP
jgi:hypothetical protein